MVFSSSRDYQSRRLHNSRAGFLVYLTAWSFIWGFGTYLVQPIQTDGTNVRWHGVWFRANTEYVLWTVRSFCVVNWRASSLKSLAYLIGLASQYWREHYSKALWLARCYWKGCMLKLTAKYPLDSHERDGTFEGLPLDPTDGMFTCDWLGPVEKRLLLRGYTALDHSTVYAHLKARSLLLDRKQSQT